MTVPRCAATQQRCATPQSPHRLISNALTSHRNRHVAARSKGVVIAPIASSYAAMDGGGRGGRKKRENRVEGRESPCVSNPLFSFAIKRKLARKEKRRAGHRAGFSLKVNLCREARSVFDLSRDCSVRRAFAPILLVAN